MARRIKNTRRHRNYLRKRAKRIKRGNKIIGNGGARL